MAHFKFYAVFLGLWVSFASFGQDHKSAPPASEVSALNESMQDLIPLSDLLRAVSKKGKADPTDPLIVVDQEIEDEPSCGNDQVPGGPGWYENFHGLDFYGLDDNSEVRRHQDKNDIQLMRQARARIMTDFKARCPKLPTPKFNLDCKKYQLGVVVVSDKPNHNKVQFNPFKIYEFAYFDRIAQAIKTKKVSKLYDGELDMKTTIFDYRGNIFRIRTELEAKTSRYAYFKISRATPQSKQQRFMRFDLDFGQNIDCHVVSARNGIKVYKVFVRSNPEAAYTCLKKLYEPTLTPEQLACIR